MEIIEFAWRSLINDISKLIIYTAIAFLIGITKLYLSALVPYISIRVFIGGIHMKTYWGCFGLTFGVLAAIIILGKTLRDYSGLIEILTWMSVLLVIFIGPQISENRKKLSKKRKKLFVICAVVLETLFLMVCKLEIIQPVYQTYIYMSLLMDNCQLIFLKKRKRR